MRANDFILTLLVMFLNLIIIAFVAFRNTAAELLVLVTLVLINILFLFRKEQSMLAGSFFSIALLNSVILFVISHELLNVAVSIINLLVLYYLINEALSRPHPLLVNQPSSYRGGTEKDYIQLEKTTLKEPKLAYETYYEDGEFFKPIREVETDIHIKMQKKK